MAVLVATNLEAAASERCLKGLYLTQILGVSINMVPWRRHRRPNSLMASELDQPPSLVSLYGCESINVDVVVRLNMCGCVRKLKKPSAISLVALLRLGRI